MKCFRAAVVLSMFPLLVCFAQSVFPVRDEGETRDRTYHVLHYRIEVALDGTKKSVTGKVTSTLIPFQPEFRTIVFDAEQMEIAHVTLGKDRPLKFDVLPKTLAIHLDRSYSYNDTLTVTVEYTCTPKKGLYFVQPDSGYPDKPWQIWSQGEDMDNHFWFPCYDFPNDFSTSEMIATVPARYTALSNGRLLGVKEDRKLGTKTFHWSETKPHVSYLTMIAVGDYAILKDAAGKLPLQYYVYPSDTIDGRVCFRETPAMINFFNEKIGFPYTWEKYAQVIVRDFIEGGMENASATTLMDDITVYDARTRVDELPTSLIAHELAHQWWGDVVTCKDWRHIWLNESFASYFDPLYTEFSRGRDEFDHVMYNNQQAGINTDATLGRKPIVSVGSYGANVYPRGSAVLHMLRLVLGDRLFWRSINHYITKHQFTPVETNDFKNSIEEVTGQNLYWFFDEWVYKAGHPVFDVSWQWSDSSGAVRLSVKQTQKIDSLTGIFRMPVDIGLTSPAGDTVVRLNILTRDTTFTIPAAAKPVMVQFDRGNWILKELKFRKSSEEWQHEAESSVYAVDRLRALHELVDFPDERETLHLLTRLSSRDPFWAVRREAVAGLARLANDSDSLKGSIKGALLAACGDKNSAVRNAAVSGLHNFKGDDVIAALRTALNDSSYAVLTSALRSLTRADSAHAEATLLAYLNVPSHNNTVTNTSLSMLATLDSARAIDSAFVKARYGEHPWTRYTAMLILSHHGKGRADVSRFVGTFLNDKNKFIRSTAIRVLGDVGNASSIPSLQTIAAGDEEDAAQQAKASIEKIEKRGDQTK